MEGLFNQPIHAFDESFWAEFACYHIVTVRYRTINSLVMV